MASGVAMRRSLAPSQRVGGTAPAPSPAAPATAVAIKTAPASSAPSAGGSGVPGGSSFSILWAKAGPKKHKAYDEGTLPSTPALSSIHAGTLLVRENYSCLIMNGDGKTIGNSRLTAKEVAALVPGHKFNASSYEIEVVRRCLLLLTRNR